MFCIKIAFTKEVFVKIISGSFVVSGIRVRESGFLVVLNMLKAFGRTSADDNRIANVDRTAAVAYLSFNIAEKKREKRSKTACFI